MNMMPDQKSFGARMFMSRALISASSPLVGEGYKEVQQSKLGEGKAATPHPSAFIERHALPSPLVGGGATTTAALISIIQFELTLGDHSLPLLELVFHNITAPLHPHPP